MSSTPGGLLVERLSELDSSVLSLYSHGYSYGVAGRLDCDTKT